MLSASIRPPALVRSQSSSSIAGAHYKHWATSLGNFSVTPFFGGNWKTMRACRNFFVFNLVVQFFSHNGNTTPIWGNREIPWWWKWRSPQNGFVERILTHQHYVHRLRWLAWVVNPEKEGNIPRLGVGKKDGKSKRGGGEANDRDKTCSKNWDTKQKIITSSLGIISTWKVD